MAHDEGGQLVSHKRIPRIAGNGDFVEKMELQAPKKRSKRLPRGINNPVGIK